MGVKLESKTDIQNFAHVYFDQTFNLYEIHRPPHHSYSH